LSGVVVVERILMMVDGSFAAETSARYSLVLTKACGAELDLLYVVVDESGGALTRAEESLLRIFRQAHSLGLKVRSVKEAGDPIRVMRDHVVREKITLAVASATRAEVGRRLLRELPCAVLLVRVVHPGRMASPNEILVPLYSGEFEGGGLEEAADLLAKLGSYWQARIVLFQVRRPVTQLFDRKLFGGGVREQEETKLHRFVSALTRRGMSPGTRVAWGRRIGEGITAEAAARRHDLIFLGTKGPRGFIQRLRAGTVDHLMRTTPCDLMLFRPAAA
jgi:nucleotide-binding universal stress UspA family protein